MSIHRLSIDLETYSPVDIKKAGLYKYVQSPDFQILLLAYSLDGAPVEVVDLAAGETLPYWMADALSSAMFTKHAYNAAFEWCCLSKFLGFPEEQQRAWLPQWRCTMVHGLYCGYPGGLAAVGKALGLPQDKQKDKSGKALIKYFCSPCKPTKVNGGRTRNLPEHDPAKWTLFKEYCRQDVVTEREVERRFSRFPVPGAVQKEWETSTWMNARGVAVDVGLAEGALACAAAETGRLTAEAARLTGLSNPNSTQQLLPWLRARGVDIPDLQKETVAEALDTEGLQQEAARVLSLRQELAKASVKKYTAMTAGICGDYRIRGLLQYYGANRTGRWAGRLVQVQNLPRTYLHGAALSQARELARTGVPDALRWRFGTVTGILSQLVRTAFVPRADCVFVDADFSAIEARVVAWLAGEQWVLDVFRTHGKIYEAAASQMFGVPIEKIVKGNPEYDLRQKGKVATLALGYQGGAPALVSMGALRMGIAEDELPGIVQRWRAANPAIVRCWRLLGNAALLAVREGRTVSALRLTFAREVDFDSGLDFLTVTLPSGRRLFYAQPHLVKDRWGRDSLGYYGVNQTTKRWMPMETYGGKLTENIVQAIARDCLAEAVERLEAAGVPVVFHIHDEVVCEVPRGRADLQKVVDIVSENPVWAPDLPLAADGWIGDFFTKD